MKDYSINFEWKSNHKVGGPHSSLHYRIIKITSTVFPMGRAVFQPHRDGDLSAGHPLLLRVRHLPAGRRQGGVCVLEEMDWRQLHLALHWSHGKLPTLTSFSFIKRTLQKFWILYRIFQIRNGNSGYCMEIPEHAGIFQIVKGNSRSLKEIPDQM